MSETVKRKRVSRGDIALAFLIVFLAVWGGYSVSRSSQSIQASMTAPDFTLPIVGSNGLTGQQISLSAFRGKVVLLEFMVPWCPHCQNMVPDLEKLYLQFGAGAENVMFLSVSAAWSGASAGDAAKFIVSYGSTWIYVYDSSGIAFSAYGVTGTPTFFIISKTGMIVQTFQGEVATVTLAADLNRLS